MILHRRPGGSGPVIMHILFLYPYLPSPRAGHGSAVLLAGLLEDLSREARLTLLCYRRPGEAERLVEAQGCCSRVVSIERPFAVDMGSAARLREALRTGMHLMGSRDPLSVLKLERRSFIRELRRLLVEDPPDLVTVELATMAFAVRHLEGLPAVLVDHEAAGPVGGGSPRWRRFMRDMLPRYDRVLTLCREDAEAVEGIVPGLRPGVRPVGVEVPLGYRRSPQPGRVLFFGSAAHEPNRDALNWLALEIAPRLRRLHPEVDLVSAGDVGASIDGDLLRRAGIRDLGFVDDLGEELARAALVLSPLRLGRGVRIKNLESLAHGVPLVTTPLGARGIDAGGMDAFRVGDDAASLAEAAAHLLARPAEAEALGLRGRELVAARHSREAQARAMLDAWREVLEFRRRTSAG